jgi:hypothetical protein
VGIGDATLPPSCRRADGQRTLGEVVFGLLGWTGARRGEANNRNMAGITELYTKAADQLGSEKAPVRLAGLLTLERLAQNTPEQRQTIVDVICTYLQMPYVPPEDQLPTEDAPAEAHSRYENRRQEQRVRLTAQNILSGICAPSTDMPVPSTSAADAGGIAHHRRREAPPSG